jgi:hypothetical protein
LRNASLDDADLRFALYNRHTRFPEGFDPAKVRVVLVEYRPPRDAPVTGGRRFLPSPAEALDLPLAAFPSWFLKITCDRRGKDRVLNEVHAPDR